MGRTFLKLVKGELEKVRNSGKGPIHSWHEGYGLLIEEVDELWEEVRKKTAARDKANALTELVQIATVAMRMAEDLNLCDKKDLPAAQEPDFTLIT